MRRSFAATLALAASLAVAVPASAQQAQWTAGDEDRSTIMEFLERDDVADAGEDLGYDMQDVGRAVLELNDDNAALVANQVRSAEQALAAETITFTVTTLIIILLVIILLILVLD